MAKINFDSPEFTKKFESKIPKSKSGKINIGFLIEKAMVLLQKKWLKYVIAFLAYCLIFGLIANFIYMFEYPVYGISLVVAIVVIITISKIKKYVKKG